MNDNLEGCSLIAENSCSYIVLWNERFSVLLIILMHCAGLKAVLGDDKVDAIINVAGGWAGGNAASKGETWDANN